MLYTPCLPGSPRIGRPSSLRLTAATCRIAVNREHLRPNLKMTELQKQLLDRDAQGCQALTSSIHGRQYKPVSKLHLHVADILNACQDYKYCNSPTNCKNTWLFMPWNRQKASWLHFLLIFGNSISGDVLLQRMFHLRLRKARKQIMLQFARMMWLGPKAPMSQTLQQLVNRIRYHFTKILLAWCEDSSQHLSSIWFFWLLLVCLSKVIICLRIQYKLCTEVLERVWTGYLMCINSLEDEQESLIDHLLIGGWSVDTTAKNKEASDLNLQAWRGTS